MKALAGPLIILLEDSSTSIWYPLGLRGQQVLHLTSPTSFQAGCLDYRERLYSDT
jgi:hypothetical protein